MSILLALLNSRRRSGKVIPVKFDYHYKCPAEDCFFEVDTDDNRILEAMASDHVKTFHGPDAFKMTHTHGQAR